MKVRMRTKMRTRIRRCIRDFCTLISYSCLVIYNWNIFDFLHFFSGLASIL